MAHKRVEVARSISSEVVYVPVDPDTSEQEVWDIEHFEAYLAGSSSWLLEDQQRRSARLTV
jgi:hypothetical protein